MCCLASPPSSCSASSSGVLDVRPAPAFMRFCDGLIIFAGLIMIVQSVRAGHTHADGAHSLTAGIGLLPCPLTISVLGFAWTQSSAVMVGLVLLSLGLGNSVDDWLGGLAGNPGATRDGGRIGTAHSGVEPWCACGAGTSGPADRWHRTDHGMAAGLIKPT